MNGDLDLLKRWGRMLGARVMQACAVEPLLQAGASVSPEARRYLQLASGQERQMLDPHAA